MKSSALIAILLFSNSLLFATESPDFKSLDTRVHATKTALNLNDTQLVSGYLTSGIWTTINMNSGKLIFQFNESGLVDIISVDEETGKSAYKKSFWQINELIGKPILEMIDTETGIESLYVLTQTWEGILLDEVSTDEKISLFFAPLASPSEFNLLKSNLVGEWTSISYPFDLADFVPKDDIMGAFLTLKFKSNGVFSCIYGNDNKKIEEAGKWQISKDGKYVIFQLETQGICQTKVALLKQVDDHLLEMMQVLPIAEPCTTTNARLKTIYFIK